jgi:hypothetical protein
MEFEHRNIADENLRAQTFGKRTEVQYGNENEKLNFFTNEVGKTFVSGKVFVEDTLITLDPKKTQLHFNKRQTER